MDEYLELQKKYEELEYERKKIAEKLYATDEKIIEWAKYYYTREKREKVIEKAKEKGISNHMVNELECCDEKWENGNFEKEDIEFFASCENNLFKKDKEKKQEKSLLTKLRDKSHEIIFGK
jgi:hypothetical protein